MKIFGFIRGQDLQINAPLMVAGSRGYWAADFFFSGQWDGLKKRAHFEQGQQRIDVDLTGDSRPREDFPELGPGVWQLCLCGLEPDGTMRITTDISTITVHETGPTGPC